MPWPGYHRGWRVVESRQPRLNTQGLFLFVPAFRCALLVIRFGLTVMRTTRHKRKPNLARLFDVIITATDSTWNSGSIVREDFP